MASFLSRYSRKQLLLALFLVAFAGLNVLAFRHARAMMTFVPDAEVVPTMDDLTFGETLQVLFSGFEVPRVENDLLPEHAKLESTTHKIPVDGKGELEAWHIPARSPWGMVVMFHGYASGKTYMLREAKALNEMGLSCFLVDLRGHGGSFGNATTLGCREAKDVAAAVGYVREQPFFVSPLVLYGHSMGGAAVLRAVSKGLAEADGLVVEGVFDTFRHTIQNRFVIMGVPSFPSADLMLFWGSVQRGFNGFAHNPVTYASKISVPVLVMHGELDMRCTKKQASQVFEALAGPREMVLNPNSGHEPLCASDPGRWKSLMAQFLQVHVSPALQFERPVDEPGG